MIEPIHAPITHIAMSTSRRSNDLTLRTETISLKILQQFHKIELGVLKEVTGLEGPGDQAKEEGQEEQAAGGKLEGVRGARVEGEEEDQVGEDHQGQEGKEGGGRLLLFLKWGLDHEPVSHNTILIFLQSTLIKLILPIT